MRRGTRLGFLILLAAVSLCAFAPRAAYAHAILVASTPKMDDTVPAGPLTVDLKFNSRVDGAHSVLSLAGADGSDHPLPLSTQVAPDEIRTETDGLTPGNYTLRWQALSSDGHITRGQIAFKVK